MKITINTNILERHHLSLGEFLIMLIGYFDIDYSKCESSLIDEHYIEKNLFSERNFILSDNSKNLVARILVESDERVLKSGIDFSALASKLQDLYPDGNKPGTTYPWRGSTDDIAYKLRVIVVQYDLVFTEEEAITAVKDYVDQFTESKDKMLLLRSFLYRTIKEGKEREANSLFVDYIENNR